MGSKSDASTCTEKQQTVKAEQRRMCAYSMWRVTPSDPPACAHRFGQYHSSSVDCLKDALQVDPSGDFSNQNRSDSLGAKLLVDAEEIDLNHFLFSKHQAKQFIM